MDAGVARVLSELEGIFTFRNNNNGTEDFSL